jgi:hypothetical protein
VSYGSRHALGKACAVALVACLAFGSVAYAALKSTAPKDVDLSGHWKLNAALSEDPHAAALMAREEQKELDKKAKKKKKRSRERAPVLRGPDDRGDSPPGESVPRRDDPSGSGPDSEEDDSADQDDRNRSQSYDPIETAITTPEEFAIQQEPEAFVLMMTESTDTCKPKQPGKVTTPEAGVAERKCGWDRNAFVVELNPTHGPLLTTRYELDKESGRLLVTSQLKGERIAKVQVKRVYERVEPAD